MRCATDAAASSFTCSSLCICMRFGCRKSDLGRRHLTRCMLLASADPHTYYMPETHVTQLDTASLMRTSGACTCLSVGTVQRWAGNLQQAQDWGASCSSTCDARCATGVSSSMRTCAVNVYLPSSGRRCGCARVIRCWDHIILTQYALVAGAIKKRHMLVMHAVQLTPASLSLHAAYMTTNFTASEDSG